MLWSTLPPTSFRNSRCLADSWIFPISRTSMAADSMEIDDSLYRQVCFAGTPISPAVAFLSKAIKPNLHINATSHLLRESSSFIPHYLWSCLSLSTSLSSRQRYVLGDNAMHQMAQSSVFLSGMGGLGIEIGRPQFKMSFYTFAIWLTLYSWCFASVKFDTELLDFCFYSEEYRSRRCKGMQTQHYVSRL